MDDVLYALAASASILIALLLLEMRTSQTLAVSQSKASLSLQQETQELCRVRHLLYEEQEARHTASAVAEGLAESRRKILVQQDALSAELTRVQTECCWLADARDKELAARQNAEIECKAIGRKLAEAEASADDLRGRCDSLRDERNALVLKGGDYISAASKAERMAQRKSEEADHLNRKWSQAESRVTELQSEGARLRGRAAEAEQKMGAVEARLVNALRETQKLCGHNHGLRQQLTAAENREKDAVKRLGEVAALAKWGETTDDANTLLREVAMGAALME